MLNKDLEKSHLATA